MKDVTSRNQPASVRRPIVLRSPGEEAVAPAESGGSPLIIPRNVVHVDPEIQALREEVTNLRQSLQQWTEAEAEWSQQRRLFQLMTDNVSDLIVLLDHQGHRSWNNTAYSHLMGYELKELAGTHALTEVHPDDRAKATEALDQTLLKGTIEQSEYRVQKKDGAWVQLQTETIPVLDGSGRVEAALLLACDATEKSKLSEALALATTKATAAGLAEGMARDFDQILTNVVGNLTIAKNLNGPHNAIAVRLNEMERSLQRARDLIEQMFSITPEQAQPKVRVHLEKTVQEAASEVLRGTMIRGEYLFPRNLSEIDVDLEAFTHAIRNIVTNSVEAMDKGVVRFSAENIPHTQFSYRHDLPLKVGDYVCLHIQDQGHGISEKVAAPRIRAVLYDAERLAGPRADYGAFLDSKNGRNDPRQFDSRGRHNGVRLSSRSDGDAPVATMPLPRAASTPASQRATVGIPKLTGTSALPMPGHKRRILLMDDEQMILDIVSRMLGHLGYEVTTCTDGSQAIAAFAKAKSQGEPFDVVMMDLVIPNGVGGQDAVHTIKKIDPSAKVLASSGHLEHPVMLDHKKFGFNAVLEKPYKLEKLQQVIEAVANAPAT